MSSSDPEQFTFDVKRAGRRTVRDHPHLGFERREPDHPTRQRRPRLPHHEPSGSCPPVPRQRPLARGTVAPASCDASSSPQRTHRSTLRAGARCSPGPRTRRLTTRIRGLARPLPLSNKLGDRIKGQRRHAAQDPNRRLRQLRPHQAIIGADSPAPPSDTDHFPTASCRLWGFGCCGAGATSAWTVHLFGTWLVRSRARTPGLSCGSARCTASATSPTDRVISTTASRASVMTLFAGGWTAADTAHGWERRA